MVKLLVIDDEPNILFSIRECLANPRLEIITATTGREGLGLVSQTKPDAVLLDIRLPDQNGIEVFNRIHEMEPRLPVIMMTAYTKTETAIDAMSRGAFDYLTKPVDLTQLKTVVQKALEVSRLNRVPTLFANGGEEPESDAVDLIVGQSAAMQEVYKSIGRIAADDGPVLILGESGTGKELVARAINQHSRRKDRPFLAINCAALPEPLLESELFGHERGAFTGADQRRIGKFEQASGGTILLDEIGDMTPATQSKALRLLQEQQFERVGGNMVVKTDVRIIAATNRDLNQLVSEGKFRLDLLYRLNGFTLRLPALRERRSDLQALTEHFVKRFNREFKKSVKLVTPQVAELFQAHDWPGNVREFQSAIRYAMLHATGDVITPDCLPYEFRHPTTPSETTNRLPNQPAAPRSTSFDLETRTRELLSDNQGDIYRRLMADVDGVALRVVWDSTGCNQAQAAELLGISRMTLRGKLRSLGLIPDRAPDSDE